MERSWIIDALGADAFERLARTLPGTELQSVLLEVVKQRAAARSPRDVRAQYRRDRFVRPCAIDQRTLLAVEQHVLAASDGFEALDLSPVTPLGTCSTVALTDQHRVLGALRATEIVSDPTNVLALECAERLPAESHLTTCQRVIRAQPVPDKPGFQQHFRIWVLGSAGSERAAHGFTEDTLVRHIRVQLAALDRLEQHGYRFGARRVDVLARADRAHVADRIAAAAGGARRPLEHPYYSAGIRYMLWVTAPDGSEVPLGDGGAFDWLATLTGNRRHVYIASGMGAQLIPTLFQV